MLVLGYWSQSSASENQLNKYKAKSDGTKRRYRQSTTIVRDLNTSLSIIDGTSRRKYQQKYERFDYYG